MANTRTRALYDVFLSQTMDRLRRELVAEGNYKQAQEVSEIDTRLAEIATGRNHDRD